MLARLSEIDVSTEGVKGAKSFFEAKVRNGQKYRAQGAALTPAQGWGWPGYDRPWVSSRVSNPSCPEGLQTGEGGLTPRL